MLAHPAPRFVVPSAMPADLAYLSIVAWPTAFDQPRRADALATCLGLERYRSNVLALADYPATIRSDPASHVITLFCRYASTPILIATIVEQPRSMLQFGDAPPRIESSQFPT